MSTLIGMRLSNNRLVGTCTTVSTGAITATKPGIAIVAAIGFFSRMMKAMSLEMFEIAI